MRNKIVAGVLAIAATFTLTGMADAGPARKPVPWSPATAAAQIAWQKGLPEVVRFGKVDGHPGCWAAVSPTRSLVGQAGFCSTSRPFQSERPAYVRGSPISTHREFQRSFSPNNTARLAGALSHSRLGPSSWSTKDGTVCQHGSFLARNQVPRRMSYGSVDRCTYANISVMYPVGKASATPQ